MAGAGKFTKKCRRRTAKAALWLTAACEPLEKRRLLSAYGPLVSVGSFNLSPEGDNPQASLTFDSNGNLWGTTYGGTAKGDGTVFELTKGSSIITTIASFNGSNGANPAAALVLDANGNLWGTTEYGGASSDGTVFEIAKGSSNITIVATFNGSNGANPIAPVAFDASGNLWGTTYNGASTNSDGTVFEIAKGSSTITTVQTFNGVYRDGAHPRSGVTFDATGNLWVTTQYGGLNYSSGASGYGTAIEHFKGGGSLMISLQGGSNGVNPEAALTFDASGNLWGTAYGGGASNEGTVFELPNATSNLTTIASFNGSNGANPAAAFVLDANGNLWGTTTQGGASSDGTVFEIANGSGSVTSVASFNGNNGEDPAAGVIFDPSGNLWGTTCTGGSGGIGTVFEIAKGSNTITTVASFNGDNGENPDAAVTFDASGNLWGTTFYGGTSNDGTVFEIAKGSSTTSIVASFNGTNGQNPAAAVTFDTSGNLWGTTDKGGTSGAGTVFEIAKGSNSVTTVSSFNGSTAANPVSPVTFDASGNLWGTTGSGATAVSGTVFEIAKGSSTISIIGGFGGY